VVVRILEENIFAAFGVVPDAVVVADSRGVIRFANSKLEQLAGYSCGELTGQKVETLVQTSRRATHRRLRFRFHSDSSQQEMYARGDLWLQRKDGVPVPVAVSLNPLLGSVDGMVVATIRDISEQERRSREDAIVAEIVALVGKEQDVDSLYELLGGALPVLFEYDRPAISVKVPGADALERVYVSGDTTAEDGVGSRVPAPE
jgi:PAS domain S-box-containing protein